MPRNRKHRARRAKAGAASRAAAPTAADITASVWGRASGEPEPADDAGWEELIAAEMLGLFARQSSWRVRNRLVAQKAEVVSFDVGLETITQRQDLETQALLGQTGGVVWDAAVVLSRFVVQHAATLGLPVGDSARWLELGAGCGAVGIAASKLLPVPVVLSDQQSILPILQKNLLENRCTARTTPALLDWGTDGATSIDLSPEQEAAGFDVIVGADCVFNQELVALLIESLLRFAGRGTAVLLAMELREPT